MKWLQKRLNSGKYKDAKHAETGLIFQSMLPAWEGFCLETPGHEQTAQQALKQIEQVLHCVKYSSCEEWILLKDDKTMQKEVRLA